MSTATSDSTTVNRWAVLSGSVAVLLCVGVIYTFSVFAVPLTKAHGWSMTEVMLAFTINGAISPVPMILGGLIVDRGWVSRLPEQHGQALPGPAGHTR